LEVWPGSFVLIVALVGVTPAELTTFQTEDRQIFSKRRAVLKKFQANSGWYFSCGM
jgi:hypothetical protein